MFIQTLSIYPHYLLAKLEIFLYYNHESFVAERKNSSSYLECLVISVIAPSFEEFFDYHICGLKSIYELIPHLFEVPNVLTSIN
jgi:hypothetical protein